MCGSTFQHHETDSKTFVNQVTEESFEEITNETSGGHSDGGDDNCSRVNSSDSQFKKKLMSQAMSQVIPQAETNARFPDFSSHTNLDANSNASVHGSNMFVDSNSFINGEVDVMIKSESQTNLDITASLRDRLHQQFSQALGQIRSSNVSNTNDMSMRGTLGMDTESQQIANEDLERKLILERIRFLTHRDKDKKQDKTAISYRDKLVGA